MKVTVARAPLARALAIANTITPNKPANPVVLNVRLEARKKKGLQVRSTDFDVDLVEDLPEAEVAKAGVVLAPCKLLSQIIGDMPAETVTLELSGTELLIKAGFDLFELPTVDPAEYPPAPAESKAPTISMKAADLAEGIRVTAPFVKSEKERYALNSVHMESAEGYVEMCGTNGHTLSIRRLPAECTPGLSVLLRPASSALIAKLCSADALARVALQLDENRVTLTLGNQVLSAATEWGQFPDYHAVVPVGERLRYTAKHAELKRAIERADRMIGDEGLSASLRLEFEKDHLTIRSMTPGRGKATVGCDIAYSGAAIACGYQPKYLLGALDAMRDLDEVIVDFDANQGAVFHGGQPDLRLCLVMPTDL